MALQRRVFKVAERIREIVARTLPELNDPRFYLVTVTSVAVSSDLRHAKVYWTLSGDKERMPDVEDAFRSAHNLFRRALAKELGIRFVPEIRFYYDDTLDRLDEVEKLMSKVSGEAAEEE